MSAYIRTMLNGMNEDEREVVLIKASHHRCENGLWGKRHTYQVTQQGLISLGWEPHLIPGTPHISLASVCRPFA